MPTIKRTVNIQYLAEGIDKIKKDFQDVDKFLPDKKSQDNLKSTLNELENLQKSIAKQDGQFSPEMAAEYHKEYSQTITKLSNLKQQLYKAEQAEASKDIAILDDKYNELDKKLKKKKSEIDKQKKMVETKDGIHSKATGDAAFTERIAKEESKKMELDMIGQRGGAVEYAAFSKNMEKVKETVKSIVPEYDKVLESMKNGVNFEMRKVGLTEEQRKQLTETIKLNHKGLDIKKAFQSLLLKENIENEKQKQLQEEILKTQELQKEEKEMQVELDKIRTEINEKQEKMDSGEYISEEDKALLEKIRELEEGLRQQRSMLNTKTQELRDSQKELNQEKKIGTKETDKYQSSLGKATQQVFNYGIAFTFLRRIYRETLRTIRDLDSALTEMAVVTSMNREEAWKLVGTMQDLARETGFTTTEVAKLSTIYFRQGRTLTEVIELTRVAGQAARVAGISAAESANYLTSAVNGFQLAASQALEVSDKFAALAASSASSYEELAVGLSKFGAQAYVAGIGMDFALGMLAKGVETTREASETIGTALKTVIARLREMTDLGRTFEDGMDVNRVETALKQVGVALRDSTGQFRDMEQVLSDVGNRWAELNTNQQASIAVALAGTRQQSRLIAIFNNFERTLELTNIAQESAGATTAQHMEYMKGMEAAMVQLQTAWQQFITTITDSELIVGIVRGLATGIETLANGLDALGVSGKTAMISIIGLATALKLKNMYAKISNTETSLGIFLSSLSSKKKTKETAQDIAANKVKAAGNKLKIIERIEKQNSIKLAAIEEKLKAKNLTLDQKELLLKEQSNLIRRINNLEKGKAIQLNIAENTTLKSGIKTKAVSIIADIKAGIAKKFLATSSAQAAASITLLNTAIYLSPLGVFALALTGIVGLFLLFKKGVEDNEKGISSFSATIHGFLKSIGEVFISLWDLLKNIFDLLKPIIAFIALKKFGAGIVVLIVAFAGLKVIIDSLTITINYLLGGLYALSNWFKETKIGKVVSGMGKGIADTFNKVKKGFSDMFSDFAEMRKESERYLRQQKYNYEELSEQLDGIRQKHAAENYELGQKNREIDSLINRYEELASKTITTQEEREELAALNDELRNLEDGDFVVLNLDGSVDQEATIKAMREQRKENARKIADNMLATAQEAIMLAQKDINAFLRNEGGGLTDVQNALLHELDYNRLEEGLEGLSEIERRAIRNYHTSLIDEAQEVNIEDLLEADLDQILSAINNFEKTLSTEGSNFSNLMESYEESLKGLEGAAKESFKETYSFFSTMADLFENQAEKISTIFDGIGMNSEKFNNLSIAANNAGYDIQSLISTVSDIEQGLDQSIDPTMRVSMAFSTLAYSVKDADLAMELFGIAAQTTTLETAQSVDHLASRIKRLGEDQQKFLSGELTDSEFFELVEDFSELFADGQFLDDFLNGRELSLYLLEEEKKAYKEYEQQLYATRMQIQRLVHEDEEGNSEMIRGLRAQEARLRVLSAYRGELFNVTKAQYKYNTLLKAHQNLQEMGISNLDLQKRALEAMQNTAGNVLARIDQDTRKVSENIDSLIKDLGKSPEDIYKIVDGVVMWKEAFVDLDDAHKRQIESLANVLENQLDATRTFYKQLMNETLAFEEEMAKQKLKTYEEYFAALDRLEKRRERVLNREDIVEQLQRLEGATDERSRKRALDLRQQLNEMDKQSAKDSREEMRQALLDSINNSIEILRQTFSDVWNQFISSGEQTGIKLFDSLEERGLINSEGAFELGELMVGLGEDFDLSNLDMSGIDTTMENIETRLNDPKISKDERSLLEEQRNLLYRIAYGRDYGENNPPIPENWREALLAAGGLSGTQAGRFPSPSSPEDSARDEFDKWLQENTRTGVLGNKILPTRRQQNKKRQELLEKYGIESFSKGGKVDYTGLAMLHGSKSKPEAVLSPQQTEMFIGFRDALMKLGDLGSGSSNSFNIENITIKTDELNNKQDFNQAGQELAKSFASAMSKRGIQLNAKR